MTEDKKGMEEMRPRQEPSLGEERGQARGDEVEGHMRPRQEPSLEAERNASHSEEPEVEGHMRPRFGAEEVQKKGRRPSNGPSQVRM